MTHHHLIAGSRRNAPLRAAWGAAAGLALGCCQAQAQMQSQVPAPPPQVTAAELNVVAPPSGPASVPDAIKAFVEGCVAHEGDRQAVVDWAINNGYEPLETLQTEAQVHYLAGRNGTVLRQPPDGQIVLVAAAGEHCMVWAENASGPKLGLAFQNAVGALARSGATTKTTMQRTVSRGGIWRRQVQVRYKRAEGAREFGLGAVTMVNRAPGTQALKFAPLAEPGAASEGESASAR